MKFALHLSFIFFFTISSQKHIPAGFVYLHEQIPDVLIDLRYYSSENFVGVTIDGYQDKKCIITVEAAHALSMVQDDLKNRGMGIKVFDAYRPQMAVDHFVRWAKNIEDIKMKSKYYPEVDKSDLFEKGYIASKSGHSRGSTVDLTLIYLAGTGKGEELDMGTPWDFFSPLSWTSSDQVSTDQKANRVLLQEVMVKYGFRSYAKEWWHFTLKNEPFPDTYFNFPIE